MKRRGLQVALTAGAIGLVVVAGVVAFNWGIVRDHAEAWWFQVTRETGTFQPGDKARYWATHRPADLVLLLLASNSKIIVCYDPAMLSRVQSSPWTDTLIAANMSTEERSKEAIKALRANGYRILEQRLPRRAYVVTGYPPPPFASVQEATEYKRREERQRMSSASAREGR